MLLRPPPPQQRLKRLNRGTLALALSILAHALLVALFLFVSMLHLDERRAMAIRPVKTNKPVVLRGITAEQWAKNRGEQPNVRDERQVVARTEKKKEEKKPEKPPEGQVVATAPGNNEVNPNAEYVSETNNSVKKETKAKEQTAFYKNAMPQRTSTKPIEGDGQDPVEVAQKAGNGGLGEDDKPKKDEASSSKLALEVPDVKAQSEVAMKSTTEGPGAQVANREEAEAIKGNSNRLNIQPGAAEGSQDTSRGRAGAPGVISLVPSSAMLDKITGAAANDHLNDVEEGEGTYLNTREWKFASFFNRVKQSVGQTWAPQEQLRMRDPTMQMFGGRDRYTILAVTLTPDGRLRDAYVEKSSGLDFLDLEAIKAFERAQPFPNPPPGILAADQMVHFQFGFFLEMSGRPGMRLFRSTD